MSRGLVAFAVAGSVLAISTAAILLRLSDAAPMVKAFYRLLYASALLAPFAWWKARDELRAMPRRDWLALGGVGAVLALHFAAWITSLDLTSVAASVVLVTLHPVFVAFVSKRLFGEGVGPLGWLGVVVALVGGVVIVWGDLAKPQSVRGDALALVGALAAAIYFLAGRGYRRRLSLLAYVMPVYAGAALVLGVLTFLPAPYGGPVAGLPMREHALFLALAVVPMILGHTVLNWALKHVTAPVIATSIVGEPVGSTILALLVLGEAPPATALAGGIVVLVGILLVATVEARRPSTVAPTG
ncbi:MAG TPA: DMT family transporter [Candidatus Thermoplasmatota archaeon]|nr:DMT family transporter [Candidatus Thermoplasmatota archaeon]